MNTKFVSTHTSIEGDPSAGASLKHAPRDPAGLCGRGAGRQNVQTVFMTPDQEIYHVVTGFLNADDLLDEMRFAEAAYKRLDGNDRRRQQTVVAMHADRLRQQGFSDREITAPANMMSEMMATTFSPEDLGLKLGSMTRNQDGRNGNMLTAMNRQRILKDHRFVMQNPLLDRDKFDAAPQSLVGHHKSFFGSVGGPHTQMMQNINGVMSQP